MHIVLVNHLVRLAQKKSVVRRTGHLNMTIAVDRDVKPQSKQINMSIENLILPHANNKVAGSV